MPRLVSPVCTSSVYARAKPDNNDKKFVS